MWGLQGSSPGLRPLGGQLFSSDLAWGYIPHSLARRCGHLAKFTPTEVGAEVMWDLRQGPVSFTLSLSFLLIGGNCGNPG